MLREEWWQQSHAPYSEGVITRHLPRIWLMTDERIVDLFATIEALPKGAGIVFRHYAMPAAQRRRLFDMVRKQTKQRRQCLILAGTPAQARAWGADGAHDRSMRKSRGLRTVAVHNGRELTLAGRIGADLIFVSPVFATRSHPGARTLGPVRLGLLVGAMRSRTIALGGMNTATARRIGTAGLHGWAAIDGLSNQKRIAVPR